MVIHRHSIYTSWLTYHLQLSYPPEPDLLNAFLKQNMKNILNCDPNLGTCIPVLLNIHGKTGRARIAIHFN